MRKSIILLVASFIGLLLAGCQQEVKVMVYFEANNNTPLIQEEVIKGALVPEPTEPQKTGFFFAGWFTDDISFENEWDFAKMKVSEEITLYANWLEEVEEWEFDSETYLAGLNTRRDFILAQAEAYAIPAQFQYLTYPKVGFPTTASWFKLYETTGDVRYKILALEQTDRILERFINEYVIPQKYDCFATFYLNYHYGMFKDKYYDDALLEKAEYVIKNANYLGSPSTTNHALLFAVGRYLAECYFPGEIVTPFWGQDNRELDDPTGEKMVRRILRTYPLSGYYEFNADTYFYCHYGPIQALAEIIAVPEDVRNAAYMANHNVLFTLAPIWLQGMLGVSYERPYLAYVSQNEGGQSKWLLWYYFGGAAELPKTADFIGHGEGLHLGFAVYSDFYPDEICIAMATDRTEKYHHQELHYYYKNRSGWDNAYQFYIQSLMDKDYAVFSSKSIVSRRDKYVQMLIGYGIYNWGVAWIGDDAFAKTSFTIQHWNNVVTDSHTGEGTSIYNQIFQHNGSVIGVYDIPVDNQYPWIVINQPKGYLAIIDESVHGRIWLHYGNVMIGYRLSTGFNFNPADEHIYTEAVTKGFFVCEVVRAEDYSGDTPAAQLEAFYAKTITKFKNVDYDYSGRTKISYVSIDGTVMETEFGGTEIDSNGKLNGEAVKYTTTDYPTQQNPWVTQAFMQEIITYTYKNKSITFDFDEMTVNKNTKTNRR